MYDEYSPAPLYQSNKASYVLSLAGLFLKFHQQIWNTNLKGNMGDPQDGAWKKTYGKGFANKDEILLASFYSYYTYSKYIIARTFSFCKRINFYSIMRILPWNSATLSVWSGFQITDRIHTWAVARLYGMLLGVWRRGIHAHHCE